MFAPSLSWLQALLCSSLQSVTTWLQHMSDVARMARQRDYQSYPRACCRINSLVSAYYMYVRGVRGGVFVTSRILVRVSTRY